VSLTRGARGNGLRGQPCVFFAHGRARARDPPSPENAGLWPGVLVKNAGLTRRNAVLAAGYENSGTAGPFIEYEHGINRRVG